MTFHYYQILPMILIIWSGFIVGKVIFFAITQKRKKTLLRLKRLIYPVILALLSLLFMPVKFTEHNMSIHEEVKFDTIEKIEVKQTDFKQDQLNQLNQLKEESKNALK